MQQSMRIALNLPQEAALSIIKLLVRITSMLLQGKTFTIQIVQRLMQITSMLQQEETFTISITQQSIRITSMLQQDVTLSIRDSTISADNFNVTAGYYFYNTNNLVQQLMQITSMLQQEETFTISITQQSIRITSMLR